MRPSFVLTAIASVVVSGCSAARSATPNSKNPAHCIAAFNYGAYWFTVGHRDRGLRNMYVRGAYEMEKWKAAGHSADEGLTEGKALTERYARDHDAMMQLFKECGTAQDADPEFRKAQPRIIAELRSKGIE